MTVGNPHDPLAAHPRGAWSAAAVYALNDVVTNGEHLYRANSPSGPVSPGITRTGSAINNSTGASNNATVVVPATTQVGDLILVALGAFGAAAMPAGYALVTSSTVNGLSSMFVYSKTAVAGDIGATVSSAIGGPRWSMQVRTYTCGGIDAHATTNGTTVRPATPSPTATVAGDIQASFFAAWATTGANSWAVTAGSLAVLSGFETGDGELGMLGEEWAIAAAGPTAVAGGVPTIVGNPVTADWECASILILPGPAALPLANFDQWA